MPPFSCLLRHAGKRWAYSFSTPSPRGAHTQKRQKGKILFPSKKGKRLISTQKRQKEGTIIRIKKRLDFLIISKLFSSPMRTLRVWWRNDQGIFLISSISLDIFRLISIAIQRYIKQSYLFQ